MELISRISLCFLTLSFFTRSIHASPSGFSLHLIHRDSPLSPYYNSSNTYFQNLQNSLRRSMSRASHIFAPKRTSSPTLQSPLTADPGEYLMKISVGTPPVDFLAVADTGSDVTWIQCKPCTECYKQKDPLFDPKKSSTYKKKHCDQSINCSSSGLSCDHKHFCTYSYTYGDGSFCSGDISSESFTFETTSGNPIVLPKITFGCGHSSGGNFDKLTDGIVGLGNSPLSIVNQLSDTINGKFAYCMVPVKLNVSSKIKFGADAVVSGPGVHKTPFFAKNADTFYYLNLKSVSVGDTNIKFETKSYRKSDNDSEGNMIIDSGTTLTFLPGGVYKKVEEEFKRKTFLKRVPGEFEFGLCYKNEKGFEKKVPNIIFHFAGADWELGAVNSMLEVDEGKICFTIKSAEEVGFQPIFGNIAQMNYAVGYDLNEKRLSFKKTDCSKH